MGKIVTLVIECDLKPEDGRLPNQESDLRIGEKPEVPLQFSIFH